jgi:hypothetical protein
MSVRICWCCQVNVAWPEYDGEKLLGEEGEKPCFECVQEDEESDG